MGIFRYGIEKIYPCFQLGRVLLLKEKNHCQHKMQEVGGYTGITLLCLCVCLFVHSKPLNSVYKSYTSTNRRIFFGDVFFYKLLWLHFFFRYLIKQYAQAASGQKLVGFMSYLNNPVKQRSSLNDSLNMSDLIEAYEHTAAR